MEFSGRRLKSHSGQLSIATSENPGGECSEPHSTHLRMSLILLSAFFRQGGYE